MSGYYISSTAVYCIVLILDGAEISIGGEAVI